MQNSKSNRINFEKMKKFLLTLIIFAFASNVMMAQSNDTKVKMKPTKEKVATMPMHECKKGEGHECMKGEGHGCMKGEGHECKKGEGHECKKGEGHECMKGEGHECMKGEGHKCMKGEGHECNKAEGHECNKAEGVKHECKNHQEGQPCSKPADQQCDNCKEKAKKELTKAL